MLGCCDVFGAPDEQQIANWQRRRGIERATGRLTLGYLSVGDVGDEIGDGSPAVTGQHLARLWRRDEAVAEKAVFPAHVPTLPYRTSSVVHWAG
jgi:hypothetical protein